MTKRVKQERQQFVDYCATCGRFFDTRVGCETDVRFDERLRVRKELLAEFAEPGAIEWRHLMTVLDHICPEKP